MDDKHKQCDCTDKCLGYLTKTCTRKENQRRLLIDMMQGDEELGLYDDSTRYAHNNFNMYETNNYQALKQGYEAGAIEMAKRRYSEEEVLVILYEQLESLDYYGEDFSFSLFWEQFKKK